MKNKRRSTTTPCRVAQSVDHNQSKSDVMSRYEVVQVTIDVVLQAGNPVFSASVKIRDNQDGTTYFQLPMGFDQVVIGSIVEGETELCGSKERRVFAIQEQDGLYLSEADALSLFQQLLEPMHATSHMSFMVYEMLKKDLSQPPVLVVASSEDEGQPLRWICAGPAMTKEE